MFKVICGGNMKILEVEFTYDKLFIKNQIISFDKNKICVIGENGVGKTTLLRILQYILGSSRNYNRNYKFDVMEYTIKISLNKKEFNTYFSHIEYSKDNSKFLLKKINNQNNHYEDYLDIESISFSKEFDAVSNKVKILNLEYKKLLADYISKFEKFALGNNFDPSDVPCWYDSDYIDKKCFKDILDCKEKYLGGNTLISENNLNLQFHLFINDGIFFNFKKVGSNFQEMKDFFINFIKYGESKIDRLTEKFILANKDLETQILNVIREINNIGESFRLVFSKYRGLSDYLKSNYKRDIGFLSAMNGYRMEDVSGLFYSLLYQFQDNYYENIYNAYENLILDNKIDEDLIFNMLRLGVFEKEYNDSDKYSDIINNYEENKTPMEEFEEYKKLKDDIKGILLNLKSKILSRNIKKDFDENFTELKFCIKRKYILSNIEEELNKQRPEFEGNNVEYFKIKEEQGHINVLFKEKGRKDLTNLSNTSSGRQWFYLYKMVLNRLSSDGILIIDEPASFLHLKAQKEILDQLLLLNQTVIYSTHSPLLLPMDKSKSSLYSLRIIKGGTHILRLSDKLDNEIISIFGLNEIRSIVIKSFKKVILVSKKQRLELKKNNIDIDVEFVELFEESDKYIKIIKFLSNYNVCYETILLDRRLNKFKLSFPKDNFYGMKKILQYATSNKINLLSQIIKGVEINESNN